MESFSRKIALRYLWSRRSEAFITIITLISILGVAIGVAVLNITMSIMTGFEFELKRKLVGANSHIVVKQLGGRMTHWEEVAGKINAMEGVSSVSPFTYHQGLLRADGSSTGLLVRGIMKDTAGTEQLSQYASDETVRKLYDPPPVENILSDGSRKDSQVPGIVVGRELLRSTGLLVGSPVSILAPNVTSTPFGLVPKFRRFVIVGEYRSGLVDYEAGLAYVDMKEAQQFFRMGDGVSGLEVRIDDVDGAPLMAKEIIDALGGLGSGLYAQDWTESNKALWDALRLEKKVYFIVLLLIIVMASFSIISTLIMIVLEKRKDIAVMRTMGASAKSISKIFRLQGGVIGLLGTLLGTALGLIGCIGLDQYGFPLDEKIFPVSQVPVRMDVVNFLVVAISAFLICLFATVYPARRASKVEPSEVLRYE